MASLVSPSVSSVGIRLCEVLSIARNAAAIRYRCVLHGIPPDLESYFSDLYVFVTAILKVTTIHGRTGAPNDNCF